MNIASIIAKKGYHSIIPAIDATIRDFKKLGYTKSEIKETLKDCYAGHDDRIDQYIKSLGY